MTGHTASLIKRHTPIPSNDDRGLKIQGNGHHVDYLFSQPALLPAKH